MAKETGQLLQVPKSLDWGPWEGLGVEQFSVVLASCFMTSSDLEVLEFYILSSPAAHGTEVACSSPNLIQQCYED
jgi:hypothetical protein